MSRAASSKSKLEARKSHRRPGSVEPQERETVAQLAWKVLNEENVKQLKTLHNVHKVAWKLADILSLCQHQESLKEAAQLDYYVAGYWYASRDCYFTQEQTSAFFTILHTLLENIKKKNLPLSENIKELQKKVSCVGVPSIPTSLECFTTKREVALILQYMQSTLFQHYALFQYLFSEEQKEEIIVSKLILDVPNRDNLTVPFPCPLEESIPMDLYKRCMIGKDDTEPASIVSFKEAKEPVEIIKEPEKEPEEEPPEAVVELEEEEKDTSASVEELEVSAEDLKALMEVITKTSLESFQSQLMLKLKEKEEEVVHRISKLEKTLKIQ